MRFLVAIPVYNEHLYVRSVLQRVLQHAPDVLVIDDGSTDDTAAALAEFPVGVIRHSKNRGYGRAIQQAFRWAASDRFDWVITMDCDEQHEPAAIPRFLDAASLDSHDVISGSRYLKECANDDDPPPERRAINTTLTDELNRRLHLNLTDAFCGYKAYRVSALAPLRLSEDGYAFPMQFWVEAAAARLRIREIPVRLIYNDPSRTFGGPLDHAPSRLAHYRDVLHRSLQRRAADLPPHALANLQPPARTGTAQR